jgi:hypothetical protein
LIEREPFSAPGGTLFLVGKLDVLLTTLDGGEATVPLSDFVALFDYLSSQVAALPSDQAAATTPRLRLMKDPT